MASDDKKDDNLPESMPTDGGGGKLGVILGAVNILFTLGIGAVVFLQFQKDKHKESITDMQLHGDDHESGHGGKKAERDLLGKLKDVGPKIITMEQFTVNLSTAVGTPPRFVRVIVAVEVPTEDTSTELTQKMPQARNAILDLFNSKRPADLQTGEGRNFLKDEIRNALNSFLVTGKVKGVFFSNFQVSS